MNYRPMVLIDDEWLGNALVFATRAEAEGNVHQLAWAWERVLDVRVDETSAPVNYRWMDSELVSVKEIN